MLLWVVVGDIFGGGLIRYSCGIKIFEEWVDWFNFLDMD